MGLNLTNGHSLHHRYLIVVRNLTHHPTLSISKEVDIVSGRKIKRYQTVSRHMALPPNHSSPSGKIFGTESKEPALSGVEGRFHCEDPA